MSTPTRRDVTAYVCHETGEFRIVRSTEQMLLLPTINLHQDVARVIQTLQLRCLSNTSNAIVTVA